jgi:hypothetical protein
MPLIATANNGNSAIISYNLRMDDGIGGPFIDIGGADPYSMVTTYTITSGIVRGRTYRVRYRVLNGAGWSPLSSVLFATAATVPTAPPSPTLSSATGTTITLNFEESSDNGGSTITGYELWMDTGTLGSAFTKVSTYTDNAMTKTLISSDGISSGSTYSFKFIA